MGFIFFKSSAYDQFGEVRGIDASREIVPRRNGKIAARVIDKADGVVETRGLRRLPAEAQHAFGCVVEPPCRPKLQAGIVARKWRELARIVALVQREKNDREIGPVAEPVEQGF